MPELQKILAEAKAGKFSSINSLSEDDLANVWENVSNYIEKKMASQKGVHIPNLGTFSFSQRKLDVGNNKYVLMQRPVFNISEKFAQTHGLQFTKYNVPGHIPSPPLNYAALSFESPFDRDMVESCVREIVGSVSRAVATKRNVELTFAGIGRLQIRDSRVKMRFYKEFINQMDGSGDLLESMQNRAGTVDSVMSDRPFSRPNTRNTVLLPKIQPGSKPESNTLAPVAEVDETAVIAPMTEVEAGADPDLVDCEGEKPQDPEAPLLEQEMEPQVGNEAFQGPVEGGDLCAGTAEGDDGLTQAEPTQDPAAVKEDRKTTPASRGPSRMAMPMAMASGISLLEDLMPPTATAKPPTATPKQPPAPPQEPRSVTYADIPAGPAGGLKPPTPPRLAPLTRSHTMGDILTQKSTQHKSGGESCNQASNHPELCFLCHKRARTNIPVSFREERKRREEEEARVLQQYQTMKDTEDMMKEQEKVICKRHDLQKIAAFNLGVSEVVTAKKKAKDSTAQKSYIFQRRPLTPPRFPKQEEYLKELTKQVDKKTAVQSKVTADDQFMERLEQVQLAEDLAAQRIKYIKDKEDEMSMYRKALDVQLRFKPVPIPARQTDNEVFGKNDTTNEILMERRRRSHLLFQEQQELVGQRKREAILKRLGDQEREQFVLEKTKQDLIDDRAHRHRSRFENRRLLEEDWKTAGGMKRARDLEERLLGLECGKLLHEQCDQYHRCEQCQRRLNNCGESNMWSESRYIPGSRILV